MISDMLQQRQGHAPVKLKHPVGGRCLQVISNLPAGSYIRGLAYDPQGHLLASVSADGSLRVWEIATKKCLAKMSSVAPRVCSPH